MKTDLKPTMLVKGIIIYYKVKVDFENNNNGSFIIVCSFKENSPWCAQAGLLLASGAQYSAVVKHFGLQLMEHTVKYRWTRISQAEKIFIKVKFYLID